jgi:hypothetical protein
LANVPGMDGNTVKQQIANLKASGNYARIIAEVEAGKRTALFRRQ